MSFKEERKENGDGQGTLIVEKTADCHRVEARVVKRSQRWPVTSLSNDTQVKLQVTVHYLL